ncbi:Hypothetical_protein [Hexamita inflata]|uniref:Hypothetical_protein n=1 Tax=Hexamita inflata TaxID=28002 RepID=A0ABP1J4J2_9EUKA
MSKITTTIEYEPRVQISKIQSTLKSPIVPSSQNIKIYENLLNMKKSPVPVWNANIPYELKNHKAEEKQMEYTRAVEDFKKSHRNYVADNKNAIIKLSPQPLQNLAKSAFKATFSEKYDELQQPQTVSLCRDDVCEFSFDLTVLLSYPDSLEPLIQLQKSVSKQFTKTRNEFQMLRGTTPESRLRRKQLQKADHINQAALRSINLLLDALSFKRISVPDFFHVDPNKPMVVISEQHKKLLKDAHTQQSLSQFLKATIPHAEFKNQLMNNVFIFVNDEKVEVVNVYLKNHVRCALNATVQHFLPLMLLEQKMFLNQFTIVEFCQQFKLTMLKEIQSKNIFQNDKYLRINNYLIWSGSVKPLSEQELLFYTQQEEIETLSKQLQNIKEEENKPEEQLQVNELEQGQPVNEVQIFKKKQMPHEEGYTEIQVEPIINEITVTKIEVQQTGLTEKTECLDELLEQKEIGKSGLQNVEEIIYDVSACESQPVIDYEKEYKQE